MMLCNYLFFASPKQKDTGDLTAQNSELKLELQTLERQVHLIDVKEEVQHPEVQMGQTIQNSGPMMNLPASYGASQHPDHDDMATLLTVQQFQQLHIHSQNGQQQYSMQPQAQARNLNLRGLGPSSIQKDNATSGTSPED
ncbi:probable transcription factor PosF21 [Olea europaea var. sylvestris]|uniref:probable transcription factor PosF21 n=1 Tax=Olea europaea var. sylvestris TaxID=158386 RepID=UPI000C1D209A|nr:probable transcription factor PosF21 [Olea europaea var. sylvestris]